MPNSRDMDDSTIRSWVVEPKVHVTDEGFEDMSAVDQAPPLWKDLMLALVVAVLLWLAAAAVFA